MFYLFVQFRSLMPETTLALSSHPGAIAQKVNTANARGHQPASLAGGGGHSLCRHCEYPAVFPSLIMRTTSRFIFASTFPLLLTQRPRSPMAEAVDLKSIQCGFESHRGYCAYIALVMKHRCDPAICGLSRKRPRTHARCPRNGRHLVARGCVPNRAEPPGN